jgi:hypothetical protein
LGEAALIRQENAVDFWRGFALVNVFINHIPGIYYERVTVRNISIADSADLFVFLAGWALFLTAGKCARSRPTGQLLSRLGARALTIYAAQILISSVAIAMLATAARILENPLLLEWHNAAPFFYDPAHTQIGLVLLTHQLGYFDILPLYVVLMLIAPFIVVLHRAAPWSVLPISVMVYFATLSFEISMPSWPNPGSWFFNPLAWQLVFVLGFTAARHECVGNFVRRNIFWFRLAAVPIVIGGALMVQLDRWPDPTRVPHPVLLFIAAKSYATPIRLLQFLAIIVLFSGTYPYFVRTIPRVVSFLSKLGRNSLNVFCAASLLSLLSQILRFYFQRNLLADTLIVVCGIALLGLTAWLSEWSKSAKRA